MLTTPSVFHNEQDGMSFFDYINSRHPNIKFTFEKENDGKLSFLDILVDSSSRDCVFSVFHKKTYTGLSELISLVLLHHAIKLALSELLSTESIKSTTPPPAFKTIINFLTP